MSARLLFRSAVAAVLCCTAMAEPVTYAEPLDAIAKQLIQVDAEVSKLRAGLSRPKQIGETVDQDLATRRLIDAQVNFGMGNYDDASVALYDFVEKYPTHRSWDEGLYYLAESLFQKGDYVASRSYFVRLASERGNQSKFYQQSLERLIELTLKLDDPKDVDRWLRALDDVPRQQLRDSVPYVRGKYAHFLGQHDESLRHFAMVPSESKYYSQAQYFTGVNYVVKDDIAKAIDTYKKLVLRAPESAEEKRVAELSHMVLGRLYYERDQPSKAVDEYLRISRRSDLFDEALYEVTWVYVKNKEFDKALRALELLALADPKSQRMPDVRILEGNLRIRKAQRVAIDGKGNDKEEYERATEVFDFTRNSFRGSYDELKKIVDEHRDASVFLQQVTGRASGAFEVKSTIPDVAVAWLRQQPEVARVVDIEKNLGQIASEVETAEASIARLEAAIDTPSRVNIFPNLAEKRIRSTEILEQMSAIRMDLIQQERELMEKNTNANAADFGELNRVRDETSRIGGELESLPDRDATASERVRRAQERYTTLDKRSAEVSTLIEVSEAQLAALRKYVGDQGSSGKIDKIDDFTADLENMQGLVNELRVELDAIRAEAVLAKDGAGVGDETTEIRKRLQLQLREALDREHNALTQIRAKTKGGDLPQLDQISSLVAQVNRVSDSLGAVTAMIDGLVDEALAEVRDALAEEKARLSSYRGEFSNYEVESNQLGGEILGLSFQDVSNKFYDILVRAEVGIVDVAWSLKESAETSLNRLNLDQARERRTLDSDFAEVIRNISTSNVQEPFGPVGSK